MITDRLANAGSYSAISSRLAVAFEYLQKTDLSALAAGRQEIQGDECYALVLDYRADPNALGVWEAHRLYIDIQYVVSGEERMGYANVEGLKITQEYDESKDALLLEGKGDFLTVRAGDFVVFFPQDAHMPSQSTGVATQVRKVVVKVLI